MVDDDLVIDILDKLIEEDFIFLAEQLLVAMKERLTDEAYKEYERLMKI